MKDSELSFPLCFADLYGKTNSQRYLAPKQELVHSYNTFLAGGGHIQSPTHAEEELETLCIYDHQHYTDTRNVHVPQPSVWVLQPPMDHAQSSKPQQSRERGEIKKSNAFILRRQKDGAGGGGVKKAQGGQPTRIKYPKSPAYH